MTAPVALDRERPPLPPADVVAEQLSRVLPVDRVVVDPDVLVGLSQDKAGLTTYGLPVVAVRPRTTTEVSAALRVAADLSLVVVPRGAGSGLAGGANALAGSMLLCLDRMTAVLEIDPVERLAVVEPGVLNGDLKTAVAAEGLWYPPDPASSAFCSIGGNVNTNAGGLCCVRWGVTSQYVLGLTLVLADGRVTTLGRRTAKGVTGYDLTKLVVGSEGTLGVVTQATLRLLPARPPVWTMAATFGSVQACGDAVVALRRAGVDVGLLEIMDRTTMRTVDAWRPTGLDDAEAFLLAQLDCSPAGLDADPAVAAFRAAVTGAGAVDVMVAADADEAAWLLDLRKIAYPAFEQLGPALLDDVCVRTDRRGGGDLRTHRVADRHLWPCRRRQPAPDHRSAARRGRRGACRFRRHRRARATTRGHEHGRARRRAAESAVPRWGAGRRLARVDAQRQDGLRSRGTAQSWPRHRLSLAPTVAALAAR